MSVQLLELFCLSYRQQKSKRLLLSICEIKKTFAISLIVYFFKIFFLVLL